jgi:hypothetical protein
VFAAQSACHFAGNTSEDFVRRVNHVPIALDFMALSGKSFHVDFLYLGVNAQMVVPLAGPALRLPAADSALLSFPEQMESPRS